MDRLAARDLRQLIAGSSDSRTPHVSIYVPLGVTTEERERARHRFGRMLQKAEAMLMRHYPSMSTSLLRPLKSLVDALPKLSPARGIAVFCSAQRVAYVPLESRVSELAIVAESFHVKPLLPMAQAHEAFYTLVLGAGSVRLYESRGDALEEKEVYHANAAGGRRSKYVIQRRATTTDAKPQRPIHLLSDRDIAAFYADVDRRVKRLLGRRRIPVVLVGTEQHVGLYRSLSRVRTVASQAVELTAGRERSIDTLRELVWPIAGAEIARHKRRLTRPYRLMRLRGKVVERLDDVARAAKEGRVDTLFIESGVQVWGRYEQGRLRLNRTQEESASDDVLDDLAELVLQAGGKVHILGRSEMPGHSPAVAILR
jgi:hypothetical protein